MDRLNFKRLELDTIMEQLVVLQEIHLIRTIAREKQRVCAIQFHKVLSVNDGYWDLCAIICGSPRPHHLIIVYIEIS